MCGSSLEAAWDGLTDVYAWLWVPPVLSNPATIADAA